ncbi:MAG TPA: radical SAM family heme chaperone HemW [Cytophagaceae bacterium]|nr:radical SAM family heme chaperone HemW [Cytophagaceae bacterium]
MPGIYIHIPFCRQACHYCDFHFSTDLKNKEKMVEMICRELTMQQDYLSQKNISTIYFGGGTPSLLEAVQLKRIMNTIAQHFTIEKNAEITLEANPDDLDQASLRAFRESGINRLSIGIQSFDDEALRYMNRAHQAKQAEDSVRLAQQEGFDNISIDLIYGVPSPDHTIWQRDLDKALTLGVQHISSYCLTIEADTVFGKRKEKGSLAPENEEYNAQQFELLVHTLEKNGYEQYEVSNFSKPGFISRHNSNYWHSEFYLGVGPGAHSFDGKSRQYNLENNPRYILAIEQGMLPFSKEDLDQKTRANEYIMTRLRTKWGIDVQVLENQFGIPFETIREIVKKYREMDFLQQDKTTLKLTKKGLLFADKITEDLFII